MPIDNHSEQWSSMHKYHKPTALSFALYVISSCQYMSGSYYTTHWGQKWLIFFRRHIQGISIDENFWNLIKIKIKFVPDALLEFVLVVVRCQAIDFFPEYMSIKLYDSSRHHLAMMYEMPYSYNCYQKLCFPIWCSQSMLDFRTQKWPISGPV